MRCFILMCFAVLCGCDSDKKLPVSGHGSANPTPIKGVPRWELVSNTIEGFQAQFPKGEIIDMSELGYDIDRTLFSSGKMISGKEYDIEKLKANQFVPRYEFRILAYRPRGKAKPAAIEDAINGRLEKLPELKGRTASEGKSVIWGGKPAMEYHYTTGEELPRVTVRKLTTETGVYVGITTENLVLIPNDVAKFFNSFELIPVK